jgi:hypothetical protein
MSHHDERIFELERQLEQAKSEREAWRGKPTEHFKTACIMVESIERELERLRSAVR